MIGFIILLAVSVCSQPAPLSNTDKIVIVLFSVSDSLAYVWNGDTKNDTGIVEDKSIRKYVI